MGHIKQHRAIFWQVGALKKMLRTIMMGNNNLKIIVNKQTKKK